MGSKKTPVPGYARTTSTTPVAKKTGTATPPVRGQLPPKTGVQGKGPEYEFLVRMARLGA